LHGATNNDCDQAGHSNNNSSTTGHHFFSPADVLSASLTPLPPFHKRGKRGEVLKKRFKADETSASSWFHYLTLGNINIFREERKKIQIREKKNERCEITSLRAPSSSGAPSKRLVFVS
jgi:hypothetical protein